MAETAFLDLMAYARGAEAATKANQADAVFNATQPYLESEAARRTQANNDLEAARQATARVAQFTADVVKEAGGYPSESRALVIAGRVANAMRSTQDPRLLSMLNSFALNQAVAARNYGDVQGAGALFNITLGQQQGREMKTLMAWQDPATWANSEAVAAQGGELLPDGQVRWAGAVWPAVRFAQAITARLQAGGAFNTSAAVAPFAEEQRQQAAHEAALQRLGLGAPAAAPGATAPTTPGFASGAAGPMATPMPDVLRGGGGAPVATPAPVFAPGAAVAPAALPFTGAPVGAPVGANTVTLPNGQRFAMPPPSPPVAPPLPPMWQDPQGRVQLLQPFEAIEARQRDAYRQIADWMRAQAAEGAKWGDVNDPYGPGYATAAPAPAPLPYFDPNAMQMPTGAAPLPWLTQQTFTP